MPDAPADPPYAIRYRRRTGQPWLTVATAASWDLVEAVVLGLMDVRPGQYAIGEHRVRVQGGRLVWATGGHQRPSVAEGAKT